MKILSAVKGFFAALLPLVFVPRCAACSAVLDSKEIPLCDNCKKAYLLESKYLCSGCNRAHRMCTCRAGFEGAKIPQLHVTAYDVKRVSVSKSMILNIKDNNIPSAFDFLATEMLTAFKERYIRLFERTNVLITFVPRSEKAKRKAGHDQSEQLACRISDMSGAVFMPLFVNNGIKAQKNLSYAEREDNARKNYGLLMPELGLDGQTVIIVDDIVTTGASIGACAALARKAGARAVIALCAAKTENKKGLTPKDYMENKNA